MKNFIFRLTKNCSPVFIVLLMAITASTTANSQTTAFTYQGRLNDGGIAANGNYDFQFDLFDAVNAGSKIGSSVINTNVSVANGIFTINLDFGGSSFPGADRFLEISVRAAGSPNPRTLLTPRQPVTSTPYSLRSLTANAADSTVSFSGALAGDVTGSQGATVVSSVGGQTASDVANGIVSLTSATSNSTSSTLVKRDGNGSFNANVVNASTGFNIAGNPVIRVSGGATNTHLGASAGASVTSGTNNTFVGNVAGSADTTGSNNTFLGGGTGGFGALNNITVIGAGALATQSNSLILGGTNGQNGVTVDTSVGIGTTAPSDRLDIGVNATHILIGSAGCANGFAGISFMVLGGCHSYSLVGDGTNTYVNRTLGGSLFLRENNMTQMTIAPGGAVGIGTTTPTTQFEVAKNVGAGTGPSILVMNSSGAGLGQNASLDFASYDTGNSDPTSRIKSINEGNFTDGISFQTKAAGAPTNGLVERMRLSNNGSLAIGGSESVGGTLTVGTGIDNNGGGLKHVRENITIGHGTVEGLGVSWNSPFTDTNYTVVATFEDTTGSIGTAITIRAVVNKTKSGVTVVFDNEDSQNHTGVVHLIGIHD